MTDLALEDVGIANVTVALTLRLIKLDADPVATGLAFYLSDELYYSLLALMLVGNELNAIAQGEPC